MQSKTTLTPDARLRIRQTFIDMCLRRQRKGTGSSKQFLEKRTTDMQWPDLNPTLNSIDWAVVGGVATRLYMPERITKDLDVIVAMADARLVRNTLQAAGYIYQGELTIAGSSWITPTEIAIDVLEGQESWWPQALKEAQKNLDGQKLPIIPLSYLVLMKLAASRSQDMGDISRLLGLASEVQIEKVRRVFKRYAPADMEDLESMIELGRLEFG